MRLVASLVWCLGSGLATTLVFPPLGLWWLSSVALVPWLVVLQRTTLARAALFSFVFGCALALPLGAWIPGVVLEGFRARPYGAYGLWVVASLSYVPALVLFGIALSRLACRGLLYPSAVGLGWLLVELSYRSVWPRVPWIQLGAPLIDTPLALSAAIWGVHGVGALVAAANALIVQALLRSGARTLAIGAGLLGMLAVASTWLGHLALQDDSPREVKIALVQPGIPLRARGDLGFQLRNLEALFELTRKLPADIQLIVWPENSLLSTLEGRPDLQKRIAGLADSLHTPLLIGAHRQTRGGRANSASLFQPGAAPRPVYDKQELLPFAEDVPPVVGHVLKGSLGRLTDRLTTGEFAGPVATGVATARTTICYEGTFSSTAYPRAELLVNLVNDSWYDRTRAAEHHLMLSRWRSVEAGAALIRAARTGISVVQDARSTIRARAGVGERSTLTAEVRVAPNVTPFERWGYVPLLICTGLVWVAALSRTGRASIDVGAPREEESGGRYWI